MPDWFIVSVSFEQDIAEAKSFYDIAEGLKLEEQLPRIEWQQPSKNYGALESFVEVLGRIDLQKIAGDVFIGLLSNAVYDYLKSRITRKKYEELRVNIGLSLGSGMMLLKISTLMTYEQIKDLVKNAVSDLIKKHDN